MAEHGYAEATRQSLLVGKGATEDRAYPKKSKRLRGDKPHRRFPRPVAGVEEHTAASESRQVLEGSVLALPLEEIRKRRGRGRQLRLSVPQPHQAFRLGEGQGSQTHGIDDAENRRVRA